MLSAPIDRGVAPKGLLQRLSWLWRDAVVQRLPVPLWLLAVGVFLVLFALGAITAVASGDLNKFLRDINCLSILALPTVASITVGYAPRIARRLWTTFFPGWTPRRRSLRPRPSSSRICRSFGQISTRSNGSLKATRPSVCINAASPATLPVLTSPSLSSPRTAPPAILGVYFFYISPSPSDNWPRPRKIITTYRWWRVLRSPHRDRLASAPPPRRGHFLISPLPCPPG